MSEQAQPDEIAIRGDEWVSADEAYRLVSGAMGDFQARITICTRAHHGLIRCRAERLVMGRESRDNVEVPEEFWWAKGHQALEQNWKAGDFSTWIKQRVECRAFGVTFHRDDVQKLIPAGDVDSQCPPESSGGRPLAETWPAWVAELAAYIHEEGVPAGAGTQGQEKIIKAIADRLAARDLEGPSRSTVQPAVQAVLRRLRSADN